MLFCAIQRLVGAKLWPKAETRIRGQTAEITPATQFVEEVDRVPLGCQAFARRPQAWVSLSFAPDWERNSR